MNKSREHLQAFAEKWIDAWNRRDMEAVLEDFHDDVVFTSPTAKLVTGVARVQGKQALRAYWTKALSQHNALQFKLERIVWDPASQELGIIYISSLNGVAKKVCENHLFDDEEKIVAADVFHGAEIQ